MNDPRALVEHFFRHEFGRLVAVLTRSLGVRRLDLAEDVVQAALVQALETWARRGVPDDPGGWLYRTARNLAIDALRREQTHDRALSHLAEGAAPDTPPPEVHFADEIGDEPLRLLFVCCHEVVPDESRVAFALRTLCGFGTAEIARGLLTTEANVQKRIERARERLRALDVDFESPNAPQLRARLDAVLSVVYLLFSQGCHATHADVPIRRDLCHEARRRTAVEAEAARPEVAAPADLSLREGLALLDEELARLPERYRAVLIVCCLEGRSRDEAAAQLGWSGGQVKGRLERAREMLRARLVRRGVELGGVLLAATVCTPAPALPPLSLLVAGTSVSAGAIALTDGVIHAMTVQKLKVVTLVLALTATAGAVTYRTAPGGTQPPGAEPAPVRAAKAAPVPPNRWEKIIREKDLTPKQRAIYEQIAKLHPAKLGPGDWGMVEIPSRDRESRAPTDELYRIGVDALPMLAEALDDETPTATLTLGREGGAIKQEKVWKVNEFAAWLIWRIADRDFVIGEFPKELSVRDIAQRPKAAPEFRKLVVDWHGTFAAKTPTERKVADVTDGWFRNRFDAVIWLGEGKVKAGRAPVAARVDAFYADQKREFSSLTRAEMSHCSLALGQIGDKASLPQVRRVCEDTSYYLETYGVGDTGMIHDLFRAYQGLALLGEKPAAVTELERLIAAHGKTFEASMKQEYAERLNVAKDW